MTISFYVNGTCVDTYTCGEILTDEDEAAIAEIKQATYRNYGYPAIIVVEDSNG